MNPKLISVIVPTYNEEKHVEECLTSIKSQRFSTIELIVIDDGSTDKTRVIAKKYSNVFLTQQHQGPGVARNKAAKVAKGEILVFIDADMYVDKDYLSNIIKPILAKKAKATFSKEEYVANPNNIWSICFQIDNNLPLNKRLPNEFPSNDNKFRAILKNEFLKVGGYLEKYGYGEDNILKSDKAIFAKGAICYHYNPDTLKEVFISAQWMGRSKNLNLTTRNILRYSFFNSLIISIKKLLLGAPYQFIIYKLVFDLGIISGILNKNKEQNYSK